MARVSSCLLFQDRLFFKAVSDNDGGLQVIDTDTLEPDNTYQLEGTTRMTGDSKGYTGYRLSEQNTMSSKCLYNSIMLYLVLGRAQSAYTLHKPVHQFIPMPTRLLWEAFSHAAITVQKLFVHISATVYSQVLMCTVEATWTEQNCPS